MEEKQAAKSLPVFDPKAKCPKCGHDELNTFYRNTRDNQWNGTWSASPLAPEWMQRVCKRCRYVWNELPLDTKPAESPSA